MQTSGGIERDLEYIEQNLKTTITAEELADMAGYSVWHYCRLFAQKTGMTLAHYICKRRIDGVLAEISGGRKAIDVVLEYGFGTYAGFYKAFVRMYGCSPQKYLSLDKECGSTWLGGCAMVTERELRRVLENWDVPQNLPLVDYFAIDGAKVPGDAWFLGDRYILRHWERSRMLKALRIEKALAAQGFSFVTPVATKSGQDFLDVSGECICALIRKMPGKPLGRADRFGEKRYDYGVKYGTSIAKLHRALRDVEPDIMPDEINLYRQVAEWAVPNVKGQTERIGMGLTDAFFEAHVNRFGAVYDKMPKQLIHRNLNPTGILFDAGEVSGFTEFDLCERNIRLWDPCYCATGILCEWQDVENIREKWPDVLRGILHGYDAVNPLMAEEKQAVFDVICAIQTVCIAWFAKQEGNGFKELVRINWEMLSYIAENSAQICHIF